MAQKKKAPAKQRQLGERAIAESLEEGLRGVYQAIEGLGNVERGLNDVAAALREVAAAIREPRPVTAQQL